ncbi:protein ANTI-SILENCING 1 isoform X2 [Rhodamnia argentea]|uniref:Protein ANTI-SILENCING 1 isoform X2 n=1 Tax=Rhodamnia argentea TaxID=178133 RepID=A0A8B8QNH5_9MYRT|nr:protein ANTI-SILENCING 1 isoform X2 [Rhodamnia argentea]
MAETSNRGDDIDFKWGKKLGFDRKNREVQYYKSFHFEGVEYSLYDCVYLFKESEPEPYIGKLIRIWQNPAKLRKVKVLWFFRPDEIVNHLGTVKPLENELFLASGEGVGLANINPLEAIAGKCHVICISEDTRNPRPSIEELQMADFVFSRTFDVVQCKIMHQIDEKIAGIEVKSLFNRDRSLNRNGVEKVVSLDKEDEDLGESELPSEALASGSGTLEGKKDGEGEEPSLKAKTNGHTCGEHLLVSPRDKTTSTVVQVDDLERPLKKRKMDASEILLSDKYKNDKGKSIDEFGVRRRASIRSGSSSENHLKSKCLGESPRGERGLILKPEQKLMELSSQKLLEVSSHLSPQKDDKNNHKALRAALPVDDKNTWFKPPPFEDRIQTARKQGTLVLLQNLDPSYASTEVEDIIWQGFKEKCSAKMLLQTTTSSPHCGQAFVIFKTREAAKRAIKQLDTGCLVLPDGRPLVGCIETPCSSGKQSKFNGHLVISNPKQPQTREMKEAVSTSHCSQPNTIVYDMAMEWCLLQQRSDFVLDKLYTQHGVELRKLKARLKSK